MTPSKSFATKNLKISSILFSHDDIKLVKAEKDPSNTSDLIFVFEPAGLAEKIVNDYFAGNLKIDPRKIFNAMETLKDKIFIGGKYG